MTYDTCPVYQGVKYPCPKCGSELADDREYHIWCRNPDCNYEEWIEGEPLDIGEVW